MIEHRRLLITANAVTLDPDWAGTHTPPTAGTDLAAGEVRELSPRGSRIVWRWEVYDGIEDSALPVAPGTATISVEFVTRERNRGEDVLDAGEPDLAVPAQKRRIEFELSSSGLSSIRVIAFTDLPATGAVWIFGEGDVDP